MRPIEPSFSLDYNSLNITVREHQLKDIRIFHIDFAGARKNLTITVGHGRKNEKFWTSIPEGRQEEAEEIGKLIANDISSKNK